MSADVCFRHATCPGISEKYELDGAQSRDAARGEARWRGREGPGADGADRHNQDAEPRAGIWRVQDGGWRVRELEGGPWRACHRTERGQDKAVIPFPGAQTAGHQLNCEADA